MKKTFKHSDRFSVVVDIDNSNPQATFYQFYYIIDSEIITTDIVDHFTTTKVGRTQFLIESRNKLNNSIKLLLEENLITIFDIDKLQLANLIIDCLS